MMKHGSILARILGYYLLYIILANVGVLLIFGVLHLFGLQEIPDITAEFVTDILVIPVLILVFHLYKKQKTRQLFEQKLQFSKILKLIPISIGARVLVVVAMAAIAGALIMIFSKDIAEVIDDGVNFQWSAFDNAKGWEYAFGFMSFAIFGPINEELLNRAIILDYLRSHYSDSVSIIYSSIIFALAHLHPGLYLSSFVLGLALATVYVKWKNIWYAVILHMLINLQPFILSYFIDKI